MGAWSPALFDDDDAADLRSDYRAYLADAQSDAAATDLAATNYGAVFNRPAETTAFWLALASIQWRMGRLDPRVKAVCLTIIDNGIDLEKWAGSPHRRKREAVLAKLRAMIASPLPAAKPMPKPLPVQLPGWAFAEVVGYRMANGKYALLHALHYRPWTTDAVRAPVVSILNWFSESVPDQEAIDRLTYINHDGYLIGGASPGLPRHATPQGALHDAVQSAGLVKARYTRQGYLGSLWPERTRGRRHRQDA